MLNTNTSNPIYSYYPEVQPLGNIHHQGGSSADNNNNRNHTSKLHQSVKQKDSKIEKDRMSRSSYYNDEVLRRQQEYSPVKNSKSTTEPLFVINDNPPKNKRYVSVTAAQQHPPQQQRQSVNTNTTHIQQRQSQSQRSSSSPSRKSQKTIYKTPTKNVESSSIMTIKITPKKSKRNISVSEGSSGGESKILDDLIMSQHDKEPTAQKTTHQQYKQRETRQDKISKDSKEFAKRFEGYIEMNNEDFANLQLGTQIRYMKHNPNSKYGFEFRSGGMLWKSYYPEFVVLRSNSNNQVGQYARNGSSTWCVPLKSKNRYFRKDPMYQKQLNDTHERNARLYNAVKTGKMMLLSVAEYEEIQEKLKK
jgi:hypothetical protein